MILTDNIKKYRVQCGMTQEQLAAKLGVSPQAVSKWETSDTYPDGSLLVSLANCLSVSLDKLFGNEKTDMYDLTEKLTKLIMDSEDENKFDLVRDICWQMEKALFFRFTKEYQSYYNPEDLKIYNNSSYILDNYGFSVVSNGDEPFFAIFPEPKEGFGDFLKSSEKLMKAFTSLSSPETFVAIEYLYSKEENFLFEPMFLAQKCNIQEIDRVISELKELNIVKTKSVQINGEDKTLCTSIPNHKLIAVFLMTKELLHQNGYNFQAHFRTTPYIRQKDIQ